jgi:hypothetical protein
MTAWSFWSDARALDLPDDDITALQTGTADLIQQQRGAVAAQQASFRLMAWWPPGIEPTPDPKRS